MKTSSTVPSPVVVIGGPTASGKSGLAVDVAAAFGGTVINADSMQLYRELDVLTARPGAEELERVPHRLYGVLPGAERGSAARWRTLALAEIAEAGATGRLPVVVGGTGLYLRALMEGLSTVPPVPEDIRLASHARLKALGGAAFRAELVARDPAMARLEPGDTTRLTRAWEVLEATGRPLSSWQADSAEGPPPGLRFVPIVLDPPRAGLYAQCDRRFAWMLERGALDEVRALAALGLDPALPVMKALGVPELLAHLQGNLPLEAAAALARQSTRRYAKRQVTWFRHQLLDKTAQGCHALPTLYTAASRDAILSFLETTLRD